MDFFEEKLNKINGELMIKGYYQLFDQAKSNFGDDEEFCLAWAKDVVEGATTVKSDRVIELLWARWKETHKNDPS